MSAKIIDGKGIAKAVRNEIAAEVLLIKASTGKIPGLAVLLVGEDPASAVYVRNKKRICEETCIMSISHNLPEETCEEDLLSLISTLNNDPGVNDILVQLPLPSRISGEKILEAIHPAKDVDGFHAESL